MTREPKAGNTAPEGPVVSAGTAVSAVDLTPGAGRQPGVASSEPRPSVRARVGAARAAPTIDLGVRPVDREAGNAGRHGDPPSARLGQRGDALEDALGDRHPGRSRRDEDELVATQPGDGVDEPDGPGEDGRDGAQDVVAGLVAGRVVRRREVVDVEDRDRDLGPLASGSGQLELEDPRERPHVGETRQRIGVGEPLEPLGALGDGRSEAEPVRGDRDEIGDGMENVDARRRRGLRFRPRRTQIAPSPCSIPPRPTMSGKRARSRALPCRAVRWRRPSADGSGRRRRAPSAAWPGSSRPTVNVSSGAGRSGSWRLIAALVAPTAEAAVPTSDSSVSSRSEPRASAAAPDHERRQRRGSRGVGVGHEHSRRAAGRRALGATDRSRCRIVHRGRCATSRRARRFDMSP